jgi:hypothetical protein
MSRDMSTRVPAELRSWIAEAREARSGVAAQLASLDQAESDLASERSSLEQLDVAAALGKVNDPRGQPVP